MSEACPRVVNKRFRPGYPSRESLASNGHPYSNQTTQVCLTNNTLQNLYCSPNPQKGFTPVTLYPLLIHHRTKPGNGNRVRNCHRLALVLPPLLLPGIKEYMYENTTKLLLIKTEASKVVYAYWLTYSHWMTKTCSVIYCMYCKALKIHMPFIMFI